MSMYDVPCSDSEFQYSAAVDAMAMKEIMLDG